MKTVASRSTTGSAASAGAPPESDVGVRRVEPREVPDTEPARFRDRLEAGTLLAHRVRVVIADEPVVVVGLPRGGVPVAAPIAQRLGAPLDVIVVRKLGVPFQPEVAMGAIGEDGVRVVNERVLSCAGITPQELDRAVAQQLPEVARRARLYRRCLPKASLVGRTAVLVDDGIATGATARAACQIARAQGATRIVLAVPVAPPRTIEEMADVTDDIVCLMAPTPFHAVGQFYEHFEQVPDEVVVTLLRRAARRTGPLPVDDALRPPVRDEDVSVPVGAIELEGRFVVPGGALAMVIFAHGSGSSRHSPRNRFVACELRRRGFGTLLFDLLTREEETDRRCVFDVATMAERLDAVTRWVAAQPESHGKRIGYFGASTGAAAALQLAADPDAAVAAVVSRGGRPDLVLASLTGVRAPTLLIVGGNDPEVRGLNEWALTKLGGEKRLAVVAGATHLFEEPRALEEVARLACDWFASHLAPIAVGQ